MQTILNLLTRTGTVYTAFEPHLSAEQYGRLLEIANTADNDQELRDAIEAYAKAEGLHVCLDEFQAASDGSH